jgi:hypothetical protein
MNRKKILFFFVFCIFFYSAAFPEKGKIGLDSVDSTNIYYRSLKLHLDYFEKSLGNRPLPASGYWDINIQVPAQLTGQLPGRIGNFRISYLDKNEVRANTKKHKSMYLICMEPVIVEDNLRTVGIVNFTMTFRKRKLNYGNGGGTRAKFRYDDSRNSFELVELRQGGI